MGVKPIKASRVGCEALRCEVVRLAMCSSVARLGTFAQSEAVRRPWACVTACACDGAVSRDGGITLAAHAETDLYVENFFRLSLTLFGRKAELGDEWSSIRVRRTLRD
jgi:hypothetical protein